MAVKFPIIINGVKFQVNPRSLESNKSVKYGSLETQSGVVFQFWYNNPEILSISGYSAGTTAFQELLFLRQNYDVTINPGKISQLFYKSKVYSGFLGDLKITHSTDRHLMFQYSMVFRLLQGEEFKIEDFALQPVGLLGRVSTILSQVVNEPIAGFEQQIGKITGRIV